MKASWPLGVATIAVLALGSGFARQGPTRVPCPSGSSRTPAIGTGRARGGDVRVNGARKRRTPLFSGNVVCTNYGLFRFDIRVGSQRASCKQRRRSSLRVHPQSNVILRFFFGGFTCGTDGSKPKTFKGPGKTVIISEDPVFSLSIDRKKTVVRMLAGSALVIGKSGIKKAVVVGPAQQTTVRAGTDPTKPTVINLSPREQADKAQLGPQTPPDFGRPDSTGSPNLTRIYRSNVLHIGLDQQSATDKATPVFVRTYLGFLADSWKLRLNLTSVAVGPALNALANGKLDLVVALSQPVFGLDELPLFWDSSKKTWSVFLNQDKVYTDGFRRFLITTVNSGKYATFYQGAFDRPPSYDPLRTVLFPK
jgi:hypothetical protein